MDGLRKTKTTYQDSVYLDRYLNQKSPDNAGVLNTGPRLYLLDIKVLCDIQFVGSSRTERIFVKLGRRVMHAAGLVPR
jgi:hypothetical protein